MTIADLSSIRVNAWQDMAADSVGGQPITLGAGATNNGPGSDLGLVTTGAANSYGEAVNYKPVFTPQGTWICRVKLPSGATGGSSIWYTGDQTAAQISAAFQGQWWIVNGNFCQCRPTDTTNVWEVLVGTWGPAGLRAYRNGSLSGTNAYTSPPANPYWDMTFGCLHYNAGYIQNLAMTMDFAAILNRQLSDAEVLDLSTNYSGLFASGKFAQTVMVSANDARYNSNGTYQNGTQVLLGQFGGVFGNLVSYFSPVSIPKGAVITSANLSVYVAGTTATPVLLIGKVGNEANAAMPTTYAACVAAAKTSGTAYSKNWASSSGYQTADITAEVQALVNRADWVSGNSLVAYLLDNGSASGKYATVDMYDMNVSHAPMIEIYYTVAGVGGVNKRQAKLGAKRTGLACGGL